MAAIDLNDPHAQDVLGTFPEHVRVVVADAIRCGATLYLDQHFPIPQVATMWAVFFGFLHGGMPPRGCRALYIEASDNDMWIVAATFAHFRRMHGRLWMWAGQVSTNTSSTG